MQRTSCRSVLLRGNQAVDFGYEFRNALVAQEDKGGVLVVCPHRTAIFSRQADVVTRGSGRRAGLTTRRPFRSRIGRSGERQSSRTRWLE